MSDTENRIKWKHEDRPVAELHPHPDNAIYSDLSELELRSLAADMATRGQQHPIDILPDGTIVGGHQRWRAAQLLGWKTIRCRVRYDLAREGVDAIEQFLLRDNFDRRQLQPLQVARVYRRLRELEKRRKSPRDDVSGDVRDFIAKRFGKSGRTLDRWARLLDAPVEIQNAVVGGKLKLIDGCKVVDLDDEIQQCISQRIGDGEEPTGVVQSYFTQKKADAENVGTLLGRFLRDLKRHTTVMSSRVDEIESIQWVDKLDDLQAALEFLGRLRDRVKAIADTTQHGDMLQRHRTKGDKK